MDDCPQHRSNRVSQEAFSDSIADSIDCFERGNEAFGNTLARHRFLRRKIELIISELQLRSGDTLLDVGCGTGELARCAANTAGRVVAVDISRGMLQVARKKCRQEYDRTEFIRADACDLPFANASVDKYVSSNMIEHIGSLDQHFIEVRRILVSGGRMVLNFPNGSTRLENLRSMTDAFLRKMAILKTSDHALLESIEGKFNAARQSAERTNGAEFVHSEMNPRDVSHQLTELGFNVTSVKTFSMIPYYTPDAIMQTRIPAFLEKLVEGYHLFPMELGSVLIAASRQ